MKATDIGEKYNLSGHRINLLLSELGMITKKRGGWFLTKQGKYLGGVEKKFKNGEYFVIWANSILKNEEIKRAVNELSGDFDIQSEYIIYEGEDFRNKYPAKIRTQDGHFVRSRGELLIDNFLYQNEIIHAYERKLPVKEENIFPDFYLPKDDIYIEYWGIEDDEVYLQRKFNKKKIFDKYGIKLVELVNDDFKNFDEIFTQKLIEIGVEMKFVIS
ncbi:MAG: hypothetical protein RLN79_01055 [Cytophagales bacterium]